MFAALFGIVIGLPTLRLRGDYLAIVTLGFGEIVPQAVNNGDNWFGHNVTNGPNGLTPIDALGFGSLHNHCLVPALGLLLGHERDQLLLLDRPRARHIHAVLLHPHPRLPARAGLGRDP